MKVRIPATSVYFVVATELEIKSQWAAFENGLKLAYVYYFSRER